MKKVQGIKGIRQITRRIKGSNVIMNNRDRLAQELVSLGTSDITDIMCWDDEGNVEINAYKDKIQESENINRAREILTKENPTDEDKEELRVLQSQDKATRTFVKNNQEIILRVNLTIHLHLIHEIEDFNQPKVKE